MKKLLLIVHIFIGLTGLINNFEAKAMHLIMDQQEFIKNNKKPVISSFLHPWKCLTETKPQNGLNSLNGFKSYLVNANKYYHLQTNKLLVQSVATAGIAPSLYREISNNKIRSIGDLKRAGIDYKLYNNEIVLMKNQRTIGRIEVITYNENTSKIDFLWVNSEFRNKGLGKILLNAAIKKIDEEGCSNILLQANPFDYGFNINQLIQFYQKFGFEVTHKNHQYATMKRTTSTVNK